VIEHIDRMPPEQWAALRDGEEDPFEEWTSDLRWGPKELHTVLYEDGRPIASVGLVVADAEVGGARFAVVGVGGVFVTHSRRRQGKLRPTLEAAIERAATLGPDFAMLFCSRANAPMYARFGFVEIEAPVVAAGQDMPPPAMWRPLKVGAAWPQGPVNLPQLPF
jgi:predicted N-acetyltransferase YhbS